MDNDPAVIEEMLGTAKTIAVVGLSDKMFRASYNIGRYLVGVGYRVLPVNPAISTVLGLKSYPDLVSADTAARAENGDGIDLVNVFRASEYVSAIVDDVIRLGVPYLWLQDEVIDNDALVRARAAGVKCVQDDCIFREHSKRADLLVRKPERKLL